MFSYNHETVKKIRGFRIELGGIESTIQSVEGSSLNHMSSCLRLRGILNTDALKNSLKYLVERHEILRTRLVTVDSVAYQEILSKSIFVLKEINLKESAFSNVKKQKEYVNALIQDEINTPFDSENKTLCRGLLIKTSEYEHILVLLFRHVISDGWSISIFNRELDECYRSFSNNKLPNFNPLVVQYGDYSLWQRGWLQGEVLEKQLDYWKEALKNLPNLILPTDKKRPQKQSYRGGVYEYQLSKEILDKLNKLAADKKVTLFMLLLAVFQGLLSRYANQEDVVVGIPITNRKVSEVENLIGFFINTLVLKTNTAGNPQFNELLKRVEEVALSAYEHQDVLFEQLVDYLNVPRDLSRHPLFQVMFILQDPGASRIKLGDLEVSHIRNVGEIQTKFDLVLNITEMAFGLHLEFEYAKDLFEASSIKRLTKCYVQFVKAILRDSKIRLSEVPILGSKELTQLESWNDTTKEYPKKYIHELFEDAAERNKDKIAVNYNEQQLSYEVLNQKGNQLACCIKEYVGFLQEKLVIGIYIERSINTVIGVLGILKARGVYVPLDPNYPEARNEAILSNSEVDILLIGKKPLKNLKSYSGQVLIIEECLEKDVSGKEYITTYGYVEDNACIIHTSGSTGQPKGVLLSQAGIVHHYYWLKDQYPITSKEVFCLKSSLNVVDSFLELFDSLFEGIKLIIVPNGVDKDPNKFVSLMKLNGITRVMFVPSYLEILLKDCRKELLNISSLKIIYTSGELCPTRLVKDCVNYLSGIDVVNLYGATESTATLLCANYTRGFDSNFLMQERNIIGTPVANTKVYILDKYLNRQPIGVIGEIYVFSPGLARGYINNPSLTAEEFIPNPFAMEEDKGNRLYKTGDLGRYLEDGNIEFLGRIDHQVKIRGFKIELGEIESTIQSVEGIRQCVVLVREDIESQKRLVSYIVLDNKIIAFDDDKSKDQEEKSKLDLKSKLIAKLITKCRKVCKSKLPDYMQPSQIVVLERLPLTPNGKIDRKALPAPKGREGLEVYEEPVNLLEKQLAKIWQNLLRIEKIGRNDNFFTIGGDSLSSWKMLMEVEKLYKLTIPTDFFQNPTLIILARIIKNSYSCNEVFQPYLKTKNKIKILKLFKDLKSFTILQLIRKNMESIAFYLPYYKGLQWLNWWCSNPLLSKIFYKPEMEIYIKFCKEMNTNLALQKPIQFKNALRTALISAVLQEKLYKITKGTVERDEFINKLENSNLSFFRPFTEIVNTTDKEKINTMSKYYIFSGTDVLKKSLSKSKGVILITYHTPLSQYMIPAICHLGYKHLTVVSMEKIYHKYYALNIQNEKNKIDEKNIVAELVYEIHTTLAKGGLVLLAGEGNKGEVCCHLPIGSRIYPLRTGFAELAIYNEAEVIPVISLLGNNGKIKIKFYEALDQGNKEMDHKECVLHMVKQYANFLETAWLQSPESLGIGRMKKHLNLPAYSKSSHLTKPRKKLLSNFENEY